MDYFRKYWSRIYSCRRRTFTENKKQRAHKEEKIKNDAIALRAQIEALTIVIGTKASSNGKIFGSVNNIQLAEAIQKQGVEVDRKCILVKGDNIKELGKYVAKIKLHKEVEFELPFEVVAE